VPRGFNTAKASVQNNYTGLLRSYNPYSYSIASRNCHNLLLKNRLAPANLSLTPCFNIQNSSKFLHDNPRGRSSLEFENESEDDRTKHFRYKQEQIKDNSWTIRFAAENGYLNWCRNVYISTIAGSSLYSQALTVPLAKEAAILLFFMGFLNLCNGTVTYIYNLRSLRSKIGMSAFSFLYHSCMALLHGALWIGALMIFLGYVEEEKDEDITVVLSEK